MSTSTEQNSNTVDAKIATESSPPGMNSITNTIGMHPNESPISQPKQHIPSGVCDKPGCTAEHSGKIHE